MKRLVIMLLLFPLIAFSQSMKNYKIGEKYTGTKKIITTFGGVDGTIVVLTTNENEIFALTFKPYGSLSTTEITDLNNAIKRHYHLHLYDMSDKDTPANEILFGDIHGDIIYAIKV